VKVSVNQRSIFLVILAMIFLLALLNGLTQSEQSHQKIAQPESKISHPVIKSPKPSQVSQKDEVIKSSLYINHASVTEIAKKLKGVGKKIAQRIVKTREQLGDFKKLEDLKAVPGMGSAKIQVNKERISFDTPIPKE
jgi:competence protein ComEA